VKRLELDDANWTIVQGYRKNILLTGDDLECDGALVQVVVIQPNDELRRHYHKTSREFYHVLDGESTVTVNDTQQVLRTGDMLMMEPGDVHSFRNGSKGEFRLLVFKTNVTENDTFWLDSGGIVSK
jgi:quercetin dioxygenase-like cupin family protein